MTTDSISNAEHADDLRLTPAEPQDESVNLRLTETEDDVTFEFAEGTQFKTRTDLYHALRDALSEHYKRFVMVHFAAMVHDMDLQVLSCPTFGVLFFDPMSSIRDMVAVVNTTGMCLLRKTEYHPSYVRKKTSRTRQQPPALNQTRSMAVSVPQK